MPEELDDIEHFKKFSAQFWKPAGADIEEANQAAAKAMVAAQKTNASESDDEETADEDMEDEEEDEDDYEAEEIVDE